MFPDRIAVVIPCYKVKKHILNVISNIQNDIWAIYVIDDACPEKTGKYVIEHCNDQRVKTIFHPQNQGVGGAVMTGYQQAIQDGAEIIVKIDGDGQMDPRLIAQFVAPIITNKADYTKGNRFFILENVRSMPKARLFGNIVLSFMSKISTGYWGVFDPTNGYTAIHANVARHLNFDKIDHGYFFETDVLFRLNLMRAVVSCIPMPATYENEKSNLKIRKVIRKFVIRHIVNSFKRIFYNYYLRDFSLASIELPLGLMLTTFGISYGGYHWYFSSQMNTITNAGTVMLAALPILIGLQLLLAFLNYDIASIPKLPVQKFLS